MKEAIDNSAFIMAYKYLRQRILRIDVDPKSQPLTLTKHGCHATLARLPVS
jgi:hypothetical protein